MQRQFTGSEPSQIGSGHSTRELEHRLTDLEAAKLASLSEREELYQIADRHHEKLTLHEKALLLILGCLSILLQDKFPAIAALLKGAL